MRILKYLFLLLLLSLVASSIFMATQKGDFKIERSKFINSPRPAVYNYVNDYKNWEDFGSWTVEDPELKISYPQNTIGKGASYSWEGSEGNGQMQTLFVKENDSISQIMDFNGTTASVFWTFKDTIGGTKVKWGTKGNMSFMFKIYAALNGGVDKVIGSMYEKSLTNLDKALDYEINTYSVKVNGLVKKPQSFYLKQTFTSEIAKVNKNFAIVISKIDTFCKENNVQTDGKPFIIYHTYDLVNGLTKISICMPIKSEIFTSAGSDILAGKLEAFEAVKTTVNGHLSHNKKGLVKANEFLVKNQLKADPIFSHIEIYTSGKSDVKNPSKWVTEIYVPLLAKVVPVKTYTPAVIKSTEPVEEPVVPKAVEPVKIIKPVVKPNEIKKTPAAKPKEKEVEQSEF